MQCLLQISLFIIGVKSTFVLERSVWNIMDQRVQRYSEIVFPVVVHISALNHGVILTRTPTVNQSSNLTRL